MRLTEGFPRMVDKSELPSSVSLGRGCRAGSHQCWASGSPTQAIIVSLFKQLSVDSCTTDPGCDTAVSASTPSRAKRNAAAHVSRPASWCEALVVVSYRGVMVFKDSAQGSSQRSVEHGFLADGRGTEGQLRPGTCAAFIVQSVAARSTPTSGHLPRDSTHIIRCTRQTCAHNGTRNVS